VLRRSKTKGTDEPIPGQSQSEDEEYRQREDEQGLIRAGACARKPRGAPSSAAQYADRPAIRVIGRICTATRADREMSRQSAVVMFPIGVPSSVINAVT
jgi:hypothetical protein